MADLSDVTNALKAQIISALAPNGTVLTSLQGMAINVMGGWPVDVASDLKNHGTDISIYPMPTEKVESWVSEKWKETSVAGVSEKVLRRIKKRWCVTVWASCFNTRDLVASALDSGLAQVERFTVSDGSEAVLMYVSSNNIDTEQKQGIYRRDIQYDVTYVLTAKRTDAVVTDFVITLNGGASLDSPSIVKQIDIKGL